MRILITGADSFIGTAFEAHMKENGIGVDVADTLLGGWKDIDFSKYDTVFHVAGITDAEGGRDRKDLYFSVNCDLAEEVAKKAKREGVGQFIFMSSIKVYGKEDGYITKETKTNPRSVYAESKLCAEKKLSMLSGDGFSVAIIRSPMVYGKGIGGNYGRLSKLARKCPVFVDVKNQRSMIYVKNLCEFVRLISKSGEGGVFFPQNMEYVNSYELVSAIRHTLGKSTRVIGFLAPVVKAFVGKLGTVTKVFGSLRYDKSLSEYADFSYCVADFKTSIVNTEAR